MTCLPRASRYCKRKLLSIHTHPITLYLCRGTVVHILRPLDRYREIPTSVYHSFIVFCVDNTELWSRIILRLLRWYFGSLQFTVHCLTTLESTGTDRIQRWKIQMEGHSLTMLMIQCLEKALSLYILCCIPLCIPLLLVIGKVQGFTIQIQRMELSLLRFKGYHLAEKTKCAKHYALKLDLFIITRHNICVQRILHRVLEGTLPPELIEIICLFSYHMKDDKIKMKFKQKEDLVYSAAMNMHHDWIWGRYLLCARYRGMSAPEYCCWVMVYWWVRSTSLISDEMKVMRDIMCDWCQLSKHAVHVLICQTIVLIILLVCLR